MTHSFTKYPIKDLAIALTLINKSRMYFELSEAKSIIPPLTDSCEDYKEHKNKLTAAGEKFFTNSELLKPAEIKNIKSKDFNEFGFFLYRYIK